MSAEALAKVKDTYIRMSLELQQAFGLRREESIKFVPSYADRGDRLVLKDSWTKGGKAREIPIRTDAQRQVLDRARQVAGRGSLIPANRNYVQQLRTYEGHTSRAGLSKLPRPAARLCPAALSRNDRLALPSRWRAGFCRTWSGTERGRQGSTPRNQPGARPRTRRDYRRVSRQVEGERRWNDSLSGTPGSPPGYSVSEMRRATSAWTATASTPRSGRVSRRSVSDAKGLHSTVLNWTPGLTTIRPATGVPPLIQQEKDYGTQTNPRAA